MVRKIAQRFGLGMRREVLRRPDDRGALIGRHADRDHVLFDELSELHPCVVLPCDEIDRVVGMRDFENNFRVGSSEVSQLYSLRVEMEVLALQWARTRVTEKELEELRELVDVTVEAGERGDRREFLE